MMAMRCPSCGFDNPEGMKFCGECAAPLQNRCPQCGFINPPQFKFCGECGAPLAERPGEKRRKGKKGKKQFSVQSLESRVERRKSKSQKSDSLEIVDSDSRPQTLDPRLTDGERRQLTVMFCDLVGSTALSAKLDPEELREVVREYQRGCADVIGRFDGHIAQYLGDGLLVYFGYPGAHEDDAQRAARAGLGIIEAVEKLNGQLSHPLHLRIGIHTGLVVVGEIGGGEKRELLALGETPNLAARVQAQAAPDTVLVSAATYRLVQGLFDCQDLGPHTLHGISTPLSLYRVVQESAAQSRFEVAVQRGLTPLVGREHEVGLLRERWERAKQAEGQVVLLGGEPGIGKSRLVQVVREYVEKDGALRLEFRCSPYHQNSAFYPVIDCLQRRLQFSQKDAPGEKLRKLAAGVQVSLPVDTLPLFASLLSLPHPEGYPPLTLSPQRQKQKTQETLVAWLVAEAERTPVYCPWEDVQWADPSTLELLTLLIDQVPTARLYLLLTFRPEFTPPWGTRSHISHLTLNRLGRHQITQMIEQVGSGTALPSEVTQQIVAKTDGIPLFVEELTKMVLESGWSVGAQHAAPLPLAIPATLHDALMARLDRLATAKEIAQVGATLGREFSYALLHAVSPLDEGTLQKGLSQLVVAELLYQRGLPPQARYVFKHALIQDAAYQSLLKSKRQQYHKQIAQVLEERFPETRETQPELLAHHYTEAGLIAQAIPYWQRAGQKAIERSASVEAISHLTKGLELLKPLPDTPERAQQELTLQIALGVPLMATKGYAASEVGQAYARARELYQEQEVEETPQLFPVLWGLWAFYCNRAELHTARELAEQQLALTQSLQDPVLLVEARFTLGVTLFFLGEFIPAQDLLEQGVALYDPQQHRSLAVLSGFDPGVATLSWATHVWWYLGYPDQALTRSHEALAQAQGLSHPYSSAFALGHNAWIHLYRREWQVAQEQAEAVITLCAEQGFAQMLAQGCIQLGWALAEQGQAEEGIVQTRQGLAAWRAMGTELWRPYYLALLAEVYGKVGRAEEGLTILAEAFDLVRKTGERSWEAELYRLKGQLTLQKFQVLCFKFQVEDSLASSVQGLESEAEECFLKAIAIARKQQAKSLELRAVMSLSQLWQQQGKKEEARQMLAEIYGWFTEGFDTADLQEAQALLDSLG
jgi:class 3 adenylate cyclase/predicted ATPase